MNTLHVYRYLSDGSWRHPLYRQLIRRQSSSTFSIPVVLIVTLLFGLWFVLQSGVQMILVALLLSALMAPVFWLLLSRLLFGYRLAGNIAVQTAALRRQQSAELYALTPHGEAGTHRAIMSGLLNSGGVFRQSFIIHRWVAVVLIVGAGGGMLISLALNSAAMPDAFGRRPDIAPLSTSLLFMLAAGGWLMIDFIGSVTSAALTGSLIGHWIDDEFQAKVWASILFVTGQFAAYALFAIMIVLCSAVLYGIGVRGLAAHLIITLFSIVAYGLIHEGITGVLLRLWALKLELNAAEWRSLFAE